MLITLCAVTSCLSATSIEWISEVFSITCMHIIIMCLLVPEVFLGFKMICRSFSFFFFLFLVKATEKVLVLEYMDGIRLNDLESLEAYGVNNQKIVEEITRAYAHQIYVDGFFNGDPHPGILFLSHVCACVCVSMFLRCGRVTYFNLL